MSKNRLDEIVLETTFDGSDTLYVPSLDEHYHSTNGAIQESKHVFIEAGLKNCKIKDKLNILEVGFGTGLNAYLTLQETFSTQINIEYTTIELYPLPIDIIKRLNYNKSMADESYKMFLQLHETPWNTQIHINDKFSICKLATDIIQIIPRLAKNFDLVYFDAFAPDKQPELWTQSVFDGIYSLMNENGILTTFCAKGIVRRMLQQSGFTVERLPGPPGKREMLRCVK